MVTLGEKRQLDMAHFGITFAFPAAGASDVAQRELTVTVNGGDPPLTRTYPAPADKSDEWVFSDGDSLVATLIDIDGHGNRSQPSAAFSYSVVDDVAPPAPGALGVSDKRQID